MPLRVTSCRKLFSVSLLEPHQIAKKHLKLILSGEENFQITESNLQEPVSGEPIPDVVVLSHCQAPRLTKYVRLVKQASSDAKILVIESSLRLSTVISLLRSGVQGFIVDEEVDEDLLSAVRTMLEGRVWIRSKYLHHGKSDGPPCDTAEPLGTSLFTPQQRRVVDLVRERLSNKEIAAELGISERTVKFHLQNVFLSLGVNSRQAVQDLPHSSILPG